jgi:arylsulfatase A-like enzyme
VDPQRFYRRSDIDNIQSLVEKYRNLYDDEILYLDSIVGRIWNIYRNSKLFDNTVFIITSDHGEHLGEKGHYTHILSLYNELLWVPLIVRYPHGLGDIGVDNRMVSLNDLYPTILDLIDSPLPRPETCYSLLSDVRRELAVAQLVLPEMYRVQLQAKQEVSKVQGGRFSPPLFAVMTDDGLKVIEKQDGDLEIFNLAQDRDEENNLVSDLSPEIMENFRHLIHVLKEETGYDARREEILNYSDKGKGCL